MATITSLVNSPSTSVTHRGYAGNDKVPYLIDVTIDFADAATAKGSALAAADVIEAIKVPAKSTVLFAGLEVITANVGGSSDVALDVGVTGIDADAWVDGFDYDAAAVGAFAQYAAAYQPIMIGGTADTVDVLIQAATTAPTGGSIRVFALMVDSAAKAAPGIAQPGS